MPWARGGVADVLLLVLVLVAAGTPQPIRAIIAGVTRNNAPTVTAALVPKLAHLCQRLFADFRLVIYEDSSRASSRAGWQLALADPTARAHYHYDDEETVTRELGDGPRDRITRLARARNKLVRLVDANYSRAEFPYFIMLDLDGVCGGPQNKSLTFDVDVFRYAFAHADEWDALGFIFVPYWDLLALRPRSIATSFAAATSHFVDRAENTFVPVDSMFMMMGVYKRSVMTACSYAGPVCEHIPFIECMRTRHAARVRVLNRVYCVGDPGWKPFTWPTPAWERSL